MRSNHFRCRVVGRSICVLFAFAFGLAGGRTIVAGEYYDVTYPPSTIPGELTYGVTYTVWVPADVQKLRGVIVHQHGCGSGACKGGETAAYDLHWQALAKKWDCALLGPSYHQEDGQNCRLWCDPRNGSEKAFLRALDDLATKSDHPELKSVPWCLWGHSGGAFWSSLMQTLHPERIVAIWFRSGTAYAVWEKGEIPKPEIPAAAYHIPAVLNPGAKEKGDARFDGAWTGAWAMFSAYRKAGALVTFAPDPRTSHECGDSRYLAIPFFDACLAMRLPEKGSADQTLRPADESTAWLAEPLGHAATPAAAFAGDPLQAAWLPNERFARHWTEYVQTGAVGDETPPSAPYNVRATAGADGGIEIAWNADADFESGIRAFIIERDGQPIGQTPETPIGNFGRPLFQSMSYHDTPERPLPAMKFTDASPPKGKATYAVIAINGVGLKSEPASGEKRP